MEKVAFVFGAFLGGTLLTAIAVCLIAVLIVLPVRLIRSLRPATGRHSRKD